MAFLRSKAKCARSPPSLELEGGKNINNVLVFALGDARIWTACSIPTTQASSLLLNSNMLFFDERNSWLFSRQDCNIEFIQKFLRFDPFHGKKIRKYCLAKRQRGNFKTLGSSFLGILGPLQRENVRLPLRVLSYQASDANFSFDIPTLWKLDFFFSQLPLTILLLSIMLPPGNPIL